MSTLLLFKDYLQHLGMVALATIVAMLACTLKGDLVLFALLTYKTYLGNGLPACERNCSGIATINDTIIQGGHSNETISYEYVPILPNYVQLPDKYKLKDLLLYEAIAVGSSLIMYHIMCGLLQLYYYTWWRDEPEKWKCQPHRFLTRSNELHEMVVGTINMTLASLVSGFLACWVVNGNHSTVYFRVDEYGRTYFFLSIILVFLYLDAGAYYSHYLLHSPWLYKTVHKHHHRYHSPTAYSFIAMSPFELVLYDCIFMAPLFLFPVHAAVYVGNLVYVYYFGLVDHSGIKMTSIFPWQPNTKFHDDHHKSRTPTLLCTPRERIRSNVTIIFLQSELSAQFAAWDKYFHVNFGFNTYLFDWLHGTQRRNDRIYGESIFGGKGRKQADKCK